MLCAAPLLAVLSFSAPTYDTSRAVNIVKELAARFAGILPTVNYGGNVGKTKSEIRLCGGSAWLDTAKRVPPKVAATARHQA